MSKKKIIKLAVIRDNDNEPCPFGLSIPGACKSVGKFIQNMAPLDAMGPDSTSEERKQIAKANQRLMRIMVMASSEEPQSCVYAGKLFPKMDKVECNYGDTAPGIKERGTLIGSPFYSQHFSGVGLDGLNSAPMGFYGDSNISRNSYYGLYSLQGSLDIEDLLKIANHFVRLSTEEKLNILK